MAQNKFSGGTGSFLIAEPSLLDDSFNRSLVLLCEHNPQGSVGFIMNKPLHIPIYDALEDFPKFDAMLYYGGPVQRDSVYFLHRLGDVIPDSKHIYDDLYWGGNMKVLKALIESGDCKPGQVRFFLGYSGWSEGQLNDEVQEKAWINLEYPSFSVMETRAQDLWKKALLEFGDKYKLWLNTPSNPNLN